VAGPASRCYECLEDPDRSLRKTFGASSYQSGHRRVTGAAHIDGRLARPSFCGRLIRPQGIVPQRLPLAGRTGDSQVRTARPGDDEGRTRKHWSLAPNGSMGRCWPRFTGATSGPRPPRAIPATTPVWLQPPASHRQRTRRRTRRPFMAAKAGHTRRITNHNDIRFVHVALNGHPLPIDRRRRYRYPAGRSARTPYQICDHQSSWHKHPHPAGIPSRGPRAPGHDVGATLTATAAEPHGPRDAYPAAAAFAPRHRTPRG